MCHLCGHFQLRQLFASNPALWLVSSSPCFFIEMTGSYSQEYCITRDRITVIRWLVDKQITLNDTTYPRWIPSSLKAISCSKITSDCSNDNVQRESAYLWLVLIASVAALMIQQIAVGKIKSAVRGYVTLSALPRCVNSEYKQQSPITHGSGPKCQILPFSVRKPCAVLYQIS